MDIVSRSFSFSLSLTSSSFNEDEVSGLVNSSSYTDTLLFWKAYENSLPLLAPLAKKFLGFSASSASVERMFNIPGHIFSNKRRTGVSLFENLSFLKLNETYL